MKSGSPFPPQKNFPPRWEEFLKALTDRLSKPSLSLPSVRCLTGKTLSHIFEDIRTDLNLPSTYPSGAKILDRLISMGLAARIPIESESDSKPSKKFVLLGIRESREFNIDPLELLQTYQPSGVICYFSALSHLNLTTQLATHHHIAILTPQKNRQIKRQADKNHTSTGPLDKSDRSRLGTIIFTRQGISYFSTKRVIRSIPGINTRFLSPWTKIRMTTLGQTLLDTLQYPFHCGGPETIFEVWEKQISTIDEDVLFEYLRKIRIPPLTRRVGAIFDLNQRRGFANF
jgi:hypothetical protein